MADKEPCKPDYPAQKTPGDGALIAEYTGCRTIVESSAARCWQTFGLFAGGALAGTILLLPNLQKIWWPYIGAVAFAIVLMLIYLLFFLRREKWRQQIAYLRMQWIEAQLGLRTNWDYLILDKWKNIPQADMAKMSPEDKSRWCEIARQHPSPGLFGWWFINASVLLVIALWIFLALAVLPLGGGAK